MKVLVITIILSFSFYLLCGCRSRRVVETQAEDIQASTLFHTASGQIMIIRKPSLCVEPAPSTEDTTQPQSRVVRRGRTPITPDTTQPQCRVVRRGLTPIPPDTTIITWNVQDTSASALHKSNHSVIAQQNQDNIIADVTARATTYIGLSALALFCCVLIIIILKLIR